MLIHTAIIVAMHVASFAQPTDWQFSKWNMTSAQVLAAAKADGRALTFYNHPKPNDLSVTYKFYMAYSSMGVDFIASMSFGKHDRLEEVELRPLNVKDCDILEKKISKIYGPVTGHWDAGVAWEIPKTKTLILLEGIQGCIVVYAPLRAGRTDPM